ncbi:MAG: pyridoxamine 5'-phosphate oxidase family protein [Actinomycetota bacterium]|nr:pyridoxamine 5'-phosphate oxidase family protein [Actinomycetota bacterium]
MTTYHDTSRPGPGPISAQPFRGLGGQPAFAPDELERFVAAPRVAVMAYTRKDGRPGQAPIWYEYHDGAFHISTADDAAKAHALRRDPRVCVTIQDERPPYRGVIFDALAETAAPGAPSGVGGIAQRYFGRIGGNKYLAMRDGEGAVPNVEFVLRPTDVRGFDNTRMVSRATTWFLRLRGHLPVLRRVL